MWTAGICANFVKYSEQMMSNHDGDVPARGRIIFPPRVKNTLFVEQRGRCMYCGRRMSNRYLEIDHKWPVSRNGGNERSNLQLLCTACNMRKGIQTDEEFRSRYWRLLPPDRTIPEPPIAQELFTAETQWTRASPEVRSIYRERFTSARRRRQPAGFEGENPNGCLTAPLLLIVALVVAALSLRGS